MSPKRTRPTYQSALTDNVRPGGPTTMDMLMRWLMKPGNVKRWRTEPRAPLIREVVDMMQEEGLAHRQPPFVRYKLIAIEKQYITAQKWLLETGMHDAYIKGKAAKEVRIHVHHLCPQFKELDLAFRSVPFRKNHGRTIDLDEESNEDEATEVEKEVESEVEQLFAEKPATLVEKRTTFRDRLFPSKENGLKLKQRQNKKSRLERQIAPSPGYAAARKSLTTTELQEDINASKGEGTGVADDSVAEKGTSLSTVQPKKNLLQRHTVSSTVKAMEPAGLTAKKKSSASAKKQATCFSQPLANSSFSRTLIDTEIANGTEEVARIVKRKQMVDSTTGTKRFRSQEQMEAHWHDINRIERDALLKRLNDEEKQRQKVYSLERAKLECELEAKRVQLLFEKAAARQRLDQLGVLHEEIDRILPLHVKGRTNQQE